MLPIASWRHVELWRVKVLQLITRAGELMVIWCLRILPAPQRLPTNESKTSRQENSFGQQVERESERNNCKRHNHGDVNHRVVPGSAAQRTQFHGRCVRRNIRWSRKRRSDVWQFG